MYTRDITRKSNRELNIYPLKTGIYNKSLNVFSCSGYQQAEHTCLVQIYATTFSLQVTKKKRMMYSFSAKLFGVCGGEKNPTTVTPT